MQTLVYFLIWGAFIFFMMRFGCGAHVMGHGHNRGNDRANPDSSSTSATRWAPPPKDIDLVCGMTVETAAAKPSIFNGHVYYFCSQDCREKFEASPGKYTSGVVTSSSTMERSHEHQH